MPPPPPPLLSVAIAQITELISTETWYRWWDSLYFNIGMHNTIEQKWMQTNWKCLKCYINYFNQILDAIDDEGYEYFFEGDGSTSNANNNRSHTLHAHSTRSMYIFCQLCKQTKRTQTKLHETHVFQINTAANEQRSQININLIRKWKYAACVWMRAYSVGFNQSNSLNIYIHIGSTSIEQLLLLFLKRNCVMCFLVRWILFEILN